VDNDILLIIPRNYISDIVNTINEYGDTIKNGIYTLLNNNNTNIIIPEFHQVVMPNNFLLFPSYLEINKENHVFNTNWAKLYSVLFNNVYIPGLGGGCISWFIYKFYNLYEQWSYTK
jgi:hypothetical protein